MASAPGINQLTWYTRLWHLYLEISHIPGYFSSWFRIIEICSGILFCETHFLAHFFLSQFRALFYVFTMCSCKGVQKLFGNDCLREWYRSQCDIWHTRLGNTVAKMQEKVAKHVVVIFKELKISMIGFDINHRATYGTIVLGNHLDRLLSGLESNPNFRGTRVNMFKDQFWYWLHWRLKTPTPIFGAQEWTIIKDQGLGLGT